MKITVIGAGYVGLSTAIGFATLGHNILCIDIDLAKIQLLKQGIVPIGEKSMQNKLPDLMAKECIVFGTKIPRGHSADFIFLALPTPLGKNNTHDPSYLKDCLSELAKFSSFDNSVIVIKSTVLPGTTENLIEFARSKGIKSDFVYNPEFLREGMSLEDFLAPERIVIGIENNVVKMKMGELFQSRQFNDAPVVFTGFRTAEISKCLSNAFLATKISFINEASDLCEKVGANINDVEQIMGLDSRIGSGALHHGIGYGGSCLPKDTKSIISLGKENDVDLSVIESADRSNDKRSADIVAKIKSHFPDSINTTLTIWGLAFKSDSDDIRESVALKIAMTLATEGFILRPYDPKVTAKQCPELTAQKNVCFAESREVSLSESNILIILNKSTGQHNAFDDQTSGLLILDFVN